MNCPTTTLFLLQSLDGKISTGDTDERDFDKDLTQIAGVKEGLSQYYALEEETDLCSFNTGQNMAKVGWNDKKNSIDRLPVSFVIFDSKPHLTERGVANLLKRTQKLYLVTSNKQHPATSMADPGLEVMTYEDEVDFGNLFRELKAKGIDRITIQSGGRMNANLLRAGLIDRVLIVIAPCLVGGQATATLVDGHSLQTADDLAKIRPLKLKNSKVLKESYLQLEYEVLN